MSPAQFRHRTSSLRLPEEAHEQYKEVVQGCEHCRMKKPPLQRSKISGLRADSFGDLIFIDHTDVKIRSETYTVFIIVDGATTFVTAFAPRTEDSHDTVQCLMEWMDTFHCTPLSGCADMAFQSNEVQYLFHRLNIRPFPLVLTLHGRTEQKQQCVCSRKLCMICVHKLVLHRNSRK